MPLTPDEQLFFTAPAVQQHLRDIRRDSATTAALMQQARDVGGYVDVGEQPHGHGVWAWLEPNFDGVLALADGYRHPSEVELNRGQGRRYGNGIGRDSGPHTVWIPERRYFNPLSWPEGQGHIEFHTSDVRNLAQLNLGNSDGVHFNTPNQPSATEVMIMRQNFRAQMNAGVPEVTSDITEELHLVWVPDGVAVDNRRIVDDWVDFLDCRNNPERDDTAGADADEQGEVDNLPDEDDEDELDLTNLAVGNRINQRDPHSNLPHNPRNPGEQHDQTGDGLAYYQTRKFDDGRIITVDRSRAHAGNRQDHKSWAVNKHGKWLQYEHFDKIDWDDQDSVEPMNRWREQYLTRAEWPKRRATGRPTYTDEQNRWLFDQLTAEGKAPRGNTARITADFNGRFGEGRERSGIDSAMNRFVKMFKENGGRFVEGFVAGRRKSAVATGVQGNKERKGSEVQDSAAKRTKYVLKVINASALGDDESEEEESDEDYEE